MLNTVLRQYGLDPARTRLLRHQDDRALPGRTPYELWRDAREQFEVYHSHQSPKNAARLAADAWASFIVPPDGSTLLAGLYQCRYLGRNEQAVPMPHCDGVDEAGVADVYELRLVDEARDLSGRLLVDWGPGLRSWIQRADPRNKPVLEIRQSFKEPAFPGPIHFVVNLSQVPTLYGTWVAALSAMRGIYLLACPRTGELYVGSAYGDMGFYQRWVAYAADGHGGNAALRGRVPSDFQVSILETTASSALPDEIFAREVLWKAKLGSRASGLNRN